ncbi:hypothetical protein R5R35_002155 [Gryllus longicercus]|uniref:Uncharacterized protein n=1 Tax=Gryllus longicercus TaxID=2509291 RepID=A0AAN9VFN6_9ORTH
MLPPAHAATATAAALLALLTLGAAGPVRPRRSIPPFVPFPYDPFAIGSEFSRAAEPPSDIPPAAYAWVKAALAHAEALKKQAQELAEALLNSPLPGWPGRRAEEPDDHPDDQPDDQPDEAVEQAAREQEEEAAKAEKAREEEEKAKEEAAKVAAMEALIHEQQLEMQARIKDAQEAMQKQLALATQGLSHLFRFRRSAAPWDFLGLDAATAALSGLRQMDELIRIQSGAPLHTVRLPGFPSHLFQRGGGFALPGFLTGFDLAQQMLEMSILPNIWALFQRFGLYYR